MRSYAIVAALIAGAGYVAGQETSLSSSCQQALTNVVASPDSDCLDASALLSLVTGGSNASIITPIDNWLSGLCSEGVCSNDTLSTVVTNITNGCSTDLSSVGFTISNDSISSIVSIVQQAYPTVRQAVCLKDTSSNQNCVTETLTNLQSSVGTLSINNIISIVPNVISGTTTIPSNVTCSDCAKQAYNLAASAYPSLVSEFATPVESQCGASFTDGSKPSEIEELATSTSTSTSSSAAGPKVAMISTGALAGIAISSVIATFAGLSLLA